MPRKDRGFSAVAIAAPLGIGGNTSAFSVANATLFRPLPVEEPWRLAVFSRGTQTTTAFSYQEYRDFRDGGQAFSGLAASFPRPVGGLIVAMWLTDALMTMRAPTPAEAFIRVEL